MKFFRKKRSASRDILQVRESDYKKELIAVGLVGVAIFVALALLSYHPYDQSLFYYSSKKSALCNWCGIIGANVAAILFFLLGGAAYGIVMMLSYTVVALVSKQAYTATLWRLSLFAGMTIMSAALLALYGITVVFGYGGGYIGVQCAQVLYFLTGDVGSQLVGWMLLVMMASVFAQLPLMSLSITAVWYLRMMLIDAWSTLKEYSVGLCYMKKTESINIAEGAMKTDSFDGEFWRQGVSDVAIEKSVIEQAQKVGDERFVALGLRQIISYRTILKIPYMLLPNTTLKRNIFVALHGEKQTSYEKIMALAVAKKTATFVLPDVSLFNQPMLRGEQGQTSEQTMKRAQKLEEKLNHFGIKGSVVSIKPGPVVTMFEYKPDIDSKISRIIALEDDLAMALTAQSMRIVAPIPGKNVIGFEIANEERDNVLFSTLFSSASFAQSAARLPIILGVDTVGNAIVADLATMPHLLVGGSTGAGKSVGLSAMLVSLLSKKTPDELKLILVDPKRLEFTPYADIPHLLFPVVTQPTRASAVLAWVVSEMEARYEAMAAMGVRTFNEFCARVTREHIADEKTLALRKAFLVVIIDELADLMMVAGKEVEAHLVRIAQMARAAGIHMIVATQRPSVDVVTGLIKVNFPSRVAFRVSSKVDSRTILDAAGAERLLGRGDMLFMHAASPDFKRVHGAYVSDVEIERVTQFWRDQRTAEYMDMNEVLIRVNTQHNEFNDDLYPQVREFIRTADEVSISMLQRVYRIGFNRSARLIERLEGDGLLAPAQGSKPRKVIR